MEVYGHRGARGLAPESTLPGYRVSITTGVDYVDLDVVMTKDHTVVVYHDLALNPDITRDKTKRWLKTHDILVKDLSYTELLQYDVGRINPFSKYARLFPNQKPIDGAVIPTLTETIRYIKKIASPTIKFQIEIKLDPSQPERGYSPIEMATAVAKIIKAEGISQRTEIQSFDWRCLLALQKITPTIPTAYLTDDRRTQLMYDRNPRIAGMWTAGYLLKDYYYSLPYMIAVLGGKLWDPQDIQVTQKNLQEAHQLGLKVSVWSSAEYYGKDIDLSEIKKLIALGVDGVITDRPDLLMRVG
ncbi:MAG: hypothetical protein A3E83_08980 [Gammaproteobacteria bacterium RIFCSPHIGHO2_12_FULL_41_20]|nr:MAG: hypothetical protein A3E83_08980 [Gammaproteobacteria bacterium RIFCSPHIGHO2_12_FULL_41_20]